MKIVKDGLYMYNDDGDLFIVKADGETDEIELTFSGTVVYSAWCESFVGAKSSGWRQCVFKRLDNKITHIMED